MDIIGNTKKITTFPGSVHNHTDYSNLRLRDAIIKTEDLLWYAAELGHKVVGITEHESLSNHVKAEKIYKEVKEKYPNFKLIRGNEIYLCRNGLNASNFKKESDKYYHCVLLAKDAIGHQQIREISTRAWRRSYMARGMRRVPTYYQDLIDVIGENKGHIIGSTACLGGALPSQLLKYRDTKDESLMAKIETWCNQMEWIFGEDNFFFELQPSATKEQTYVNKMLVDLANEWHFRYIITTDSHYLRKEDAKIHKAYLNAQNGDREVDSFYATTYMMSDKEIRSYLENDLTEEQIQEGYRGIESIYEMCEDYSIQRSLYIPQLPWKEVKDIYNHELWTSRIPMLKNFWKSEYDGDKYLANAIIDGINRHKECDNQEAYDEINECLKMTWESSEVNKAHWSAYFLNLQRIIDECWEAGSLVGCGRGSGVGFILLYLLDITQINPMKETTKTFRWRLTRKGQKVSYLW